MFLDSELISVIPTHLLNFLKKEAEAVNRLLYLELYFEGAEQSLRMLKEQATSTLIK